MKLYSITTVIDDLAAIKDAVEKCGLRWKMHEKTVEKVPEKKDISKRFFIFYFSSLLL